MHNILINFLKYFYGSLFIPELLFYEIKHLLSNGKPRIGFANEYIEGNLYEIYLRLEDRASCFWVISNIKVLKDLKKRGIEAYYYWNPGVRLMRPNAWVVSNFGRIPVKTKNTLWVSTDHSINFRGVSKELIEEDKIDFIRKPKDSQLNAYDIHFLSSDITHEYYKNIGLNESSLKVVGHPRTDTLVKNNFNRESIINSMNLDPNKKTILYAPTHSHELNFDYQIKKGLFPGWSNDQAKLLEEICLFMKEKSLNFIIRLHRHDTSWTDKYIDIISKFNNTFKMTGHSHPDSMPYIFVSDVLITDISSIANDYLILDRPIIYLKPDYDPFDGVYSLSTSYLAGYYVMNKQDFYRAIDESLQIPEKFSSKRNIIKNKLHYKLDGMASDRAAKIILEKVKEEEITKTEIY